MTRVVEKVRIAKAADALWQEIGSFGAVGRWYPMLSRVETTGERDGCLRTAEGRDGSRQTERLIKALPGRRSYCYRMEQTALPVRDYTAELRVDDNSDNTSTVVWSADFEPVSDDTKTIEGIREFLKAGLNNIAALYGRPQN
jgi:hypothetical protein